MTRILARFSSPESTAGLIRIKIAQISRESRFKVLLTDLNFITHFDDFPDSSVAFVAVHKIFKIIM